MVCQLVGHPLLGEGHERERARSRLGAFLDPAPAHYLNTVDHLLLTGFVAQRPPVPVGGRFEVGDAPRRHLAVQVVELPVVPALAWPQTCRWLSRTGSWGLAVQHRLSGVLPEALEPEDLDQWVVERDADEQTAHAFVANLLAEVLDQPGRNLVLLGAARDAQVQHLEGRDLRRQ